jgi:hypothetical protein
MPIPSNYSAANTASRMDSDSGYRRESHCK